MRKLRIKRPSPIQKDDGERDFAGDQDGAKLAVGEKFSPTPGAASG